MNTFQTKMRVLLGPGHLCPGRTRHRISDGKGIQDFPAFVRLEIASYPGDDGYYLLHICQDGSMADTHHATIGEALHQAEWEFDVKPAEWQDLA